MQSALRKIGNSTGLVIPRTLLGEIGAAAGTSLDLTVEDGRLIATPVVQPRREGWAHAAAEMTHLPDAEAEVWTGFTNEGDATLTW